MNQKKYFRDIWGLFNSINNYPGAFPRGLVNAIKKRGWYGKRRVWLFSGSFKDPHGITVDINPNVGADYSCNCEELPFDDECFDFVMLDPPYSEKEARELYSLPYFSIVKVMNEAARICESGGYVILLHRILPFVHPNENIHKKRLKLEAIVGVFTVAGYTNLRALSVWRKEDTLNDYFYTEKEVKP